MSTRGAAAVVAGLILLVGAVLGFSTHSVPNNTIYSSLGDTVSCGSTFFGGNDPGAADFASGYASSKTNGLAPSTSFQAQCDAVRSTPRTVALILTSIGALGLLFLALTNKPSVQPVLAAPEGVEQQ